MNEAVRFDPRPVCPASGQGYDPVVPRPSGVVCPACGDLVGLDFDPRTNDGRYRAHLVSAPPFWKAGVACRGVGRSAEWRGEAREGQEIRMRGKWSPSAAAAHTAALALTAGHNGLLCQDRLRSDAVWDILVAECGAVERGRARFSAYLDGHEPPSGFEYRFTGSLGDGGKHHRQGGREWVSCYAADETPVRLASIAAANLRLSALDR
jgi:hypothetical protein